MDTIFERLTQFLNEDELRHITPLKMLGLYREQLRIVPVNVGVERAFLMLLPRAASQWATAKYPSASLVIFPVLLDAPSTTIIAACVTAILENAGAATFVVNTCEFRLISALRGAMPTLIYQRALLTFTPDCNAPGGLASRPFNPSVRVTGHIPYEARALLGAHDVYSANELQTMFADGSARCLLSADGEAADRPPVAIALAFPNTTKLHEIGSLYVAPHARRAGHASALVRAALAEIASRDLAVRYVVDATNEPSIELATRCGLREVMRLEHWLSA